MVKKAETISKVIKIGNSKGVIIDKKTSDYLNLEIDDIVKITIEKEENEKLD